MKVNLKVSTTNFCSFVYVAQITKDILHREYGIDHVTISTEYKEGYRNILIEDGVVSTIMKRKADIWWTDSPGILPTSRHKWEELISEPLFEKNYPVTNYCKHLFKELGIKTEDETIPRPINEALFHYVTDYKYKDIDLFTVGDNKTCHRKNIHMHRQLVADRNYRYVAITNIMFPRLSNVLIYDFGSVDEQEKLTLYSRSKFYLHTSSIEGFGVPVLEAMAAGVPVIYTDCPAHNEFAVGIPIPVSDKTVKFCYGSKIEWYDVNYNDILEAVDYALSLSREEYEDLSVKARDKALEIYRETVDKIKLLIS